MGFGYVDEPIWRTASGGRVVVDSLGKALWLKPTKGSTRSLLFVLS